MLTILKTHTEKENNYPTDTYVEYDTIVNSTGCHIQTENHFFSLVTPRPFCTAHVTSSPTNSEINLCNSADP